MLSFLLCCPGDGTDNDCHGGDQYTHPGCLGLKHGPITAPELDLLGGHMDACLFYGR